MSALLGFFTPWILAVLVLVGHLVIPARKIIGYAKDALSGVPLTYRTNGGLVFVVVVLLWLLAGTLGTIPFDWFWTHRWYTLIGSLVLSILATACAIWRVPKGERSWISDFFLGRRFNPRFIGNRVDAKMFLYLYGAIFLELNLLSFAAHHGLVHNNGYSPGIVIYLVLFTWFLCDYLVFERVHTYTYDLVAENLGFKLIGGCLVVYPFFYAIGLWAVVELPDPSSPWWLVTLAVVAFVAGWVLARGSNLQKYQFKKDPTRTFLGFIEPKVVTDGEKSLLCSGFWRLSRHINYLGEFLMATGLTLALGWPHVIVVWLYPLYYVLLLAGRERDDDRRCAAKYGVLWDRYRERVPWRIIPRVY